MSKLAHADTNFDVNGFQTIIPGASHTLTTSGTSQLISGFAVTTTLLRLQCTEDCFIQRGLNPVASSSTMFLKGGTVEFIGILDNDKLAVIQSTTSGTFYCTEAV